MILNAKLFKEIEISFSIMVITQHRSKRNPRGARYHAYRKKKLYEKGREPTQTKIGESNIEAIKTKGGNYKVKVNLSDVANVFNKKTKKYEKAKIKAVVENPANRHFIRRNIITKGAVIDTDKGKARVTSRPGQDGTINAVSIS